MPKQNAVSVFHERHLSHNNSINPVITDSYESVSPCWYKAIPRYTKNDSKNISRKNKYIRNWPAKLQSLWNFSISYIQMKDSLQILKHCIDLTRKYSHILQESFFEPTKIHWTELFVQKFNFIIKDGGIQISNIQANESLV